MNICILYDITDSPWGGGNQFLKAVTGELEAAGHHVTRRPDANTELVLLNSYTFGPGRMLRPGRVAQLRQTGKFNILGRIVPKPLWMKLGRQGPVLVHRLDGVTEVGRGVRTIADDLHPIINRLSDHTVFQSRYSQNIFAEHSSVVPASSRIIHNGVDPRIFYPDSDKHDAGQVLKLVAISWSPNPRKGFSTLAEISLVPGIELTFIGNWCQDIPPAEVKLAGVLGSREVADIVRRSDALLHAGLDEACSNVIVEGLASGLPVIYRDSGANRELVADCGLPLEDDLPSVIARLRAEYVELRQRVLDQRPRFLISRAAGEYASFFAQALGKGESTSDLR